MNLRSILPVISGLVFLLVFNAQGQIQKPVKWSFSSEKKGKEVVLLLKATVDKGWHLYAQDIPEGGPIATTFKYTPSANYALNGKTTQPAAEEVFDPNFEMKLSYFGGTVVFKQKIKLLNEQSFKVDGTVEFMVCNDNMCLPPEEIEFSIPVEGDKSATATPESKDQSSATVTEATPEADTTTTAIATTITAPPAAGNGRIPDPSGDVTVLEKGCNLTGEEAPADRSVIGIFIAGMLGGFLALLTPCVFPMIPLTVSFFTKRSKTREKGIMNAAIYAVSIILIYVSLGFLVTVTLGSDALNAMASNVYFNLLFFILFFIFALSFFGAFEITLPASWINKADTAADKGGLLGIFFMAFTLSLVSFSCTGPIIGTLLVEAAHGRSYLGPIAGMTGFSVALALPFALFAAFPGWLNTLPKSGGWLNSVKVTLGFLELALAMKFLSNVDLAYHWGFLKRELFIAIWVVIFGLMGLYLLGKLKFSHDSDTTHVSTGRLIASMIALTFTFYLLPGIFGAPLRLISGFPPPEFYKEWVKEGEHTGGECPHNLNCYHDYEAGMAYAKSVGKPVIVDFTGWSCVNCRKMEDNVWSQPAILKQLSDDYVLISLYVDDKTPLDSAAVYTSSFSGKKIKSTGNKWSDLQSRVFNTNSQPYYVLLDHNGKLLAEPRGYTPDADLYGKFLKEGLCRFKLR